MAATSHVLRTTARLTWMRLPCFGHNLHLAVINSTKEDPRVQRTVENLCLVSHTAGNDLTKAQSDLGLPQHALVTDCVNRWGSQLKMTSRILEQEASI